MLKPYYTGWQEVALFPASQALLPNHGTSETLEPLITLRKMKPLKIQTLANV